MTEVKKAVTKKKQKRPAALPTQKSATDTSNWENRTFVARSISKNGELIERNAFVWYT